MKSRTITSMFYDLMSFIWKKYCANTGLFEMIVGGLTTCHTQYT